MRTVAILEAVRTLDDLTAKQHLTIAKTKAAHYKGTQAALPRWKPALISVHNSNEGCFLVWWYI